MTVIPIAVGVLGTVNQNQNLEISGRIKLSRPQHCQNQPG